MSRELCNSFQELSSPLLDRLVFKDRLSHARVSGIPRFLAPQPIARNLVARIFIECPPLKPLVAALIRRA